MIDPLRKTLADYVLDESNAPIRIVGAAISLLRMTGGPIERRVADAADRAIVNELEAMKAEHTRDVLPGPVKSFLLNLRCFLFHRRYVLRLPGYEPGDVQCWCRCCDLMWLECHGTGRADLERTDDR